MAAAVVSGNQPKALVVVVAELVALVAMRLLQELVETAEMVLRLLFQDLPLLMLAAVAVAV
jgi:hypothetical protein